MTDREHETLLNEPPGREPGGRRDFLISLGRWSKVVIGGVLLGGMLTPERDAVGDGYNHRGYGRRGDAWINFGGDWEPRPWVWGWYNRPWYNRPWYNRPWYNRPWYNGPGWGGSWYNR